MKCTFILIMVLFFNRITSFEVMAQNAIPIPDTLSGSSIHLVLREGIMQFYKGVNTATIGYNGNYLGPTIILEKGQQLQMKVENQLNETTTTHWHGLHVSPANDGSPHNPILSGQTWTPSFTIMDNAGMNWYHPHLHGKTFKQVIKGAAGLILIRDQEEAALALPRTYGVDDIPLIFQFQSIDVATKQILLNDELDNTVLVNGTLNPMVNCPAQMVRLRLLNASSHRVFRFGLNDNRIFYQIASDGGLLNAPVQMTRLNLGNGERAEIIVDFSNQAGKTFYIQQFGNELPTGFMGGPTMMFMRSGPLDNKNFDLIQINIVSPNSSAIKTLPTKLMVNTPWSKTGATTRNFNLTAQPMMSTNFFINSVKYDEQVINFITKKDNIEIWNISNQTMMAHPFHIHGNPFYIVSINGSSPPANMLGKKDVVMVPPMNGSVSIITKFNDFSDSEMPYMYHCHILSHEDNGMMGQFIVSPGNTTNSSDIASDEFIVYPLISNGELKIINQKEEVKIEKFRIFDPFGRVCFSKIISQNEKLQKLDVSQLANGYFFIEIQTDKGIKVYKFLNI